MEKYSLLNCENCKASFERKSKTYKYRNPKTVFCSNRCRLQATCLQVEFTCSNCKQKIQKSPRVIKKSKSGLFFCNRSCATRYNNKNKKHGNRRSKLEVWLEQKLLEEYPTLEFHFNRKDSINSELDIYIPALKVAFELNGIFHYEPIFGSDKLSQIQNNDRRKYQACLERGIELCIIDSSSFGYFKIESALKYLNIIVNVIELKQK